MAESSLSRDTITDLRTIHEWYRSNLPFDKFTKYVAAEIEVDDGFKFADVAAAMIGWRTQQRDLPIPWGIGHSNVPYTIVGYDQHTTRLPEDATHACGSSPTAEFNTVSRENLYQEYDINPVYDDPAAHQDRTPPDWPDRREAILDLYTERCGRCRRRLGRYVEKPRENWVIDDGTLQEIQQAIETENVTYHVHHVHFLNNGGTHELSNLVPLCIKCHSLIHPTVDSDSLGNLWRWADLYPHQNADPRVAVERLPADIFEIFYKQVIQEFERDSVVASLHHEVSESEVTADVPGEIARLKENPSPPDLGLWEQVWLWAVPDLFDRPANVSVMIDGTTVPLISLAEHEADSKAPLLDQIAEIGRNESR